mmetsp:Transcript_16990/g.35665  ORF Transcript_16990/g.35665 Transcript_16990/m.35665 type:complete len:678 (+) Transcript_16990:2549-4582(+)
MLCSGNCGMQKIRRNANYYTDRNKQNFWCERCYGGLKETDPIQLDDGKETKKKLLVKLKNDFTPEEIWIQCEECKSWAHQICALFNPKQASKVAFTCPKCYLKEDLKRKGCNVSNALCGARELPKCKLSDGIEEGLAKALLKAYKQVAIERDCTVSQVEKAENLIVRVVLNLQKKHKVREEMMARYANKHYPSYFPVKTKCIFLFQSIHGVDVLLFGMYVYEYGDECPAPNRRRVYISYLDSVRYLEPSCYRTLVYQTIIVEYLRFVRSRGYHTAHIWSCPPSKGDEYIFYCHPPQQLTPRDDMLCAWYLETLNAAKNEGVVLETRTLYDEYFKNDGIDPKTGEAFDPTSLPYFDGDYIPGEIENIIKDLNKSESSRVVTKCKASNLKSAATSQRKEGKRLGTRSNPGELVNQGRDKVMIRLDLVLSRMKQNFIVAQLLSDEFIEAVENSEAVSAWMERTPRNFNKKQKGKNPSILHYTGDYSESGYHLFDNKIDTSLTEAGTLPETIGNTEDFDPLMEQECLDTRLQFLNYCQKNNFQFDELRRAKFSTMMLLCHLHNPKIELEHKIKIHLEVVAHAATCTGPPLCTSSNCLRMKQLFDHVKGCDITYKRGCKICTRLFMLLTKHARDCDSPRSCAIPFCDRIRERNICLLKQQQLIDDRRRNAQNNRHRPENISC